jgi:hypothetical protein
MAARRFIDERNASAQQRSAEGSYFSDIDDLLGASSSDSDEPLDAPSFSWQRAERRHEAEEFRRIEQAYLFGSIEEWASLQGFSTQRRLDESRLRFVDGRAKLACAYLLAALHSPACVIGSADVSAFCGSIAAALPAHRADFEVQLFGCRALCVMRSRPGFDAEVALDAVLQAQRDCLADEEAQHRILTILSFFARHNDEMALYLVQQGALESFRLVVLVAAHHIICSVVQVVIQLTLTEAQSQQRRHALVFLAGSGRQRAFVRLGDGHRVLQQQHAAAVRRCGELVRQHIGQRGAAQRSEARRIGRGHLRASGRGARRG